MKGAPTLADLERELGVHDNDATARPDPSPRPAGSPPLTIEGAPADRVCLGARERSAGARVVDAAIFWRRERGPNLTVYVVASVVHFPAPLSSGSRITIALIRRSDRFVLAAVGFSGDDLDEVAKALEKARAWMERAQRGRR